MSDFPAPAALLLDNLTLVLGARVIVEDFSLALAHGDIGCLLGGSGSGKTTLLRAIAGLIPPQAGRIVIHGEEVSSRNFSCPPEKRRLGLMFQDIALFPHLNVAQNIGFGLFAAPIAEKEEKVRAMLELVGLKGFGQRRVQELSGGQQQRVALARSLAPRPRLLMMDEPFSSLDATLRTRLAKDIRDILKDSGTTTLMVTHDQQEAFAMSDQIAVMNNGHLEQWASPYDVYHRPATRFVANFIGEHAWLPGEVLSDGNVRTALGVFALQTHNTQEKTAQFQPSQKVDFLLRPDDVIHDDQSALTAQVLRREFRGASFLYRLRLVCGQELLALVPSHHDHAIGEWIGVQPASDHLVVFASLADSTLYAGSAVPDPSA